MHRDSFTLTLVEENEIFIFMDCILLRVYKIIIYLFTVNVTILCFAMFICPHPLNHLPGRGGIL
jgi:NADH:ubiquinone oxidoreductase subunit 6 (subunit J)